VFPGRGCRHGLVVEGRSRRRRGLVYGGGRARAGGTRRRARGGLRPGGGAGRRDGVRCSSIDDEALGGEAQLAREAVLLVLVLVMVVVVVVLLGLLAGAARSALGPAVHVGVCV